VPYKFLQVTLLTISLVVYYVQQATSSPSFFFFGFNECFASLQFITNQGLLVAISNENEIQVSH